MNDVQSQFIAVCPECSADLTVNFEKLGQHIACPQCHRTFVAGEASLPDNHRSVDKPAVPVNQAKSQVDRIDVVCTNCSATLRVRRAYIGNDVRCKYCDQVFRVRAAAGTQARTEAEEPDRRQKSLQAEHEQLYVAHNLLQADHDRLKTEYTGLRENLRCVTTEIEAIRDALGTIAPKRSVRWRMNDNRLRKRFIDFAMKSTHCSPSKESATNLSRTSSDGFRPLI